MDRGAWQATQSMGSQRVGHDQETNTFTISFHFPYKLHGDRNFLNICLAVLGLSCDKWDLVL